MSGSAACNPPLNILQLMATPEILIYDARMLELMDTLKQSGKIRFFQEFCNELGIAKTYLDQVRNHGRSFTPNHISLACKVYNANANWILGIEDHMFRFQADNNPLQS